MLMPSVLKTVDYFLKKVDGFLKRVDGFHKIGQQFLQKEEVSILTHPRINILVDNASCTDKIAIFAVTK